MRSHRLIRRALGAAFRCGQNHCRRCQSANLKTAKAVGAHETILIKKSEKKNDWEPDKAAVQKIMQLTYGKGVDISMEMAGPPSSLNNCIESTRRGDTSLPSASKTAT